MLRSAGIIVDTLDEYDSDTAKRLMEASMATNQSGCVPVDEPLLTLQDESHARGEGFAALDADLYLMWQLAGLIDSRVGMLDVMDAAVSDDSVLRPPGADESTVLHSDRTLVFEGTESSTFLPNGAIQALKRSWAGTDFCAVAAHPAALLEWRKLAAHVLSTLRKALDLALIVVAECNEVDDESTASNLQNQKGALKVDCRGHLIVESSGRRDEASRGQMIVVAGWMLVKEACELLACMVQHTPLAETASKSSGGAWVMDYNQVKTIGDHFLAILLSLKHQGAVEKATIAFQSICETLLQSGVFSEEASGEKLCRLPRMWLDYLLRRLREQKQSFLLRRSGGFASSFLAIARSEPRGCSSQLLPTLVQNLINLVGEGLGVDVSRAELEGRQTTPLAVPDASADVHSAEDANRLLVHCLNVLKRIFSDAILSRDLQPYFAIALELALVGFRSIAWNIRNSSMMLYSATVKRLTTVSNLCRSEVGGDAVGITTVRFFSCYPTLHPCLMRELHEGAASTHNALHPSLYPVLTLISRLRPPSNGSESNGGKVPYASAHTELIELIWSCLGHKSQMVRKMAAVSIAAIAPLCEIGVYLERCFNYVLQHSNNRNGVHGMLLLAEELLRVMERCAKSAKLHGVASSLVECIECAKTFDSGVVLEALFDMLAAAQYFFSDVSAFSKACANIAIATASRILDSGANARAWASEAIPYAFGSFAAVYTKVSSLADDTLSKMLSMNATVRLSLLPGLRERFRALIEHRPAGAESTASIIVEPIVQSLLSDIVALTTGHHNDVHFPDTLQKCLLLTSMVRYFEHCSVAALQLLDAATLLDVLPEITCPRCKGGVIILCGELLRTCGVSGVRARFIETITRGSYPDADVDIRRSVVEFLARSDILQIDSKAAPFWLAALRLVQDDVLEVRMGTLLVLQEKLTSLGVPSAGSCDVDQMIHEIYELFARESAFANSVCSALKTQTQCVEEQYGAPSMRAAHEIQKVLSKGADLGLFSSDVYEIEADNMFTERLLNAQLSALCLGQLQKECSQGESWFCECAGEVAEIVEKLKSPEALAVEWFGGATCHPKIYERTIVALLCAQSSLQALKQPSQCATQKLACISSLNKLLSRPWLIHPSIRRLAESILSGLRSPCIGSFVSSSYVPSASKPHSVVLMGDVHCARGQVRCPKCKYLSMNKVYKLLAIDDDYDGMSARPIAKFRVEDEAMNVPYNIIGSFPDEIAAREFLAAHPHVLAECFEESAKRQKTEK